MAGVVDPAGALWHGRRMATPTDVRRKHRHDLGQEDHGAKLAAGTTRGLQILLATWLVATAVLVIWAMIDAA